MSNKKNSKYRDSKNNFFEKQSSSDKKNSLKIEKEEKLRIMPKK